MSSFFGSKPIDIPYKMVPCIRLALICHFLVLDPHLKAMGPNYGPQPIGLAYFIGAWTLDPHLKYPLKALSSSMIHLSGISVL